MSASPQQPTIPAFRTMGPPVLGTPNGYQVCPLLEITGLPWHSKLIIWVVLDPYYSIVYSGTREACEAEANHLDDELEAKKSAVPGASGP